MGVDAGDPGKDRTVSWVNPKIVRGSGGLAPETRIGPDIHGILVLPDDGKALFLRMGRASGTVRSNPGDFVKALQEAFPESDVSERDCPSIRRAVRLLNLAAISTEPISKVVLAVSTVEGLVPAGPSWTDVQTRLIEDAAARLKGTHGDGEETGQVVKAIKRIRSQSTGGGVKKMLDSNGLSDLWQDWRALYRRRSRLFHGTKSDGREHRGNHLAESELHALGEVALTLCGRIVLSMAKRKGIPVPSRAGVHFRVE